MCDGTDGGVLNRVILKTVAARASSGSLMYYEKIWKEYMERIQMKT